MSHANAIPRLSYAEYLALEAKGETKHEFLEGAVFAMAGGTPEHGAVAMAAGHHLSTALAGRPCRVFSSDVRVRVLETGLATYPDVSVVCGHLETDPEDPDAITNPTLIVEVLSPRTEVYDRRAKAAHYRRIPSLGEYVLVNTRDRVIEIQRRAPSGIWQIHEARPGQMLDLTSLGISLDVASLFSDPLAPAGA